MRLLLLLLLHGREGMRTWKVGVECDCIPDSGDMYEWQGSMVKEGSQPI